MSDGLSLLSDLIARARAAGADAADAAISQTTSLGVQWRLGNVEHVERSESRDFGLRVFLGKRVANVSSSIVDPSTFDTLVERAIAMAKVVPEDPYAGLAEDAAIGETFDPTVLDLVDPSEPDTQALLALAERAEQAGLAVAGVTNSEGASAGFGRREFVLVTSAGFAGQGAGNSYSVSMTALAGSGTAMQRDYDYSSAVHLADLEDATLIGHTAGEKAVARLNPTRPKTGRLPVVYDPRVASSLIGHLVGAINGASVARGTTFLKDKLGQQVFPKGVAIVDDPLRRRGLRSALFDGEGVRTRPLRLVDDGVVTTWILDSRSARQLGLKSTGSGSRGGGPSTRNLYLEAGTQTPAELMADIREGLYITELIGMGVNGLTGDYSRGAAGFMIRDGALAEPVAEITIAGTLQEMFAHMTPANDLRFRRGTDAPTVRVDGLTVAGA